MLRYDLNGQWKMREYPNGQWIDANVPGSVFNDLLNSGIIEDPFYRDNEDKVKKIALYDYQYTREFYIDDIYIIMISYFFAVMVWTHYVV